jgi:hypothetical protein
MQAGPPPVKTGKGIAEHATMVQFGERRRSLAAKQLSDAALSPLPEPVNLDFLSKPVDFQTAYFLIFEAAAVYAFIMLALLRIHERRAERHQK